jgi:uncharacterized membrane protein
MITLTPVYWLLGLYFGALAWRGLRDIGNPRRHTTALFWALLALLLFTAEHMPVRAVGACVVVLVLIAGFGGLRAGRYGESTPETKRADAARFGHRLFLPALLIPAITVVGTLSAKHLQFDGAPLFDSANTATLTSLAIACVAALVVACAMTRQSPNSAVEQSRRLVDAIGWAALLPLLLATLGSVFQAAGVDAAVSGVVRAIVPVDNPFLIVVAYGLGMALFTIIMGNAFAAFPVMTGGIALPLLVELHGADAASLAAIGMLSGYCGTLMTPMAANFNLVPAALLELKDPYGVIRAQWRTGAVLLACNIVLMYVIAFR